MKKTILGLLLVFVAGIVFGQTIVVIPFSTRGQTLTRDDAASITELFTAELAKRDGVRVVDRTSLARVVREMQFQNTDWSNPQKTAQLGSALNAEFMVRGQLNQLGQQISVAITAFDIKTLEVVSSSTKTFDVNKIFDNTARDSSYPYGNISIFGVMPDMARDIVNSIPPPNYFIGRWQTADGGCILEFRANGTMRVERYVYGSTTYNNGTGVYSFDRNGIEIILNLQGAGERITTRAYGRNVFGQRYDYTKISYSFNGPKNNISFGENGLMSAYWSGGYDSGYSFYTSLTKIQ